MEEKGTFGLLFDLSFGEFVTTRVIKVLFVLGVVLAGIACLIMLGSGFKGGFGSGLIALILTPIIFIIWTLLIRMWCELIIVAFRIAENTSRLVEQGNAKTE
jgi:uncharacterized membrane protein